VENKYLIHSCFFGAVDKFFCLALEASIVQRKVVSYFHPYFTSQHFLITDNITSLILTPFTLSFLCLSTFHVGCLPYLSLTCVDDLITVVGLLMSSAQTAACTLDSDPLHQVRKAESENNGDYHCYRIKIMGSTKSVCL
jgi:hypothetical protein